MMSVTKITGTALLQYIKTKVPFRLGKTHGLSHKLNTFCDDSILEALFSNSVSKLPSYKDKLRLSKYISLLKSFDPVCLT